MCASGFRYRVWGSGFRGSGFCFLFYVFGFRVWGSVFRVLGVGFGVSGFKRPRRRQHPSRTPVPNPVNVEQTRQSCLVGFVCATFTGLGTLASALGQILAFAFRLKSLRHFKGFPLRSAAVTNVSNDLETVRQLQGVCSGPASISLHGSAAGFGTRAIPRHQQLPSQTRAPSPASAPEAPVHRKSTISV